MCCDAPAEALLPPPVAAALAEYRALHARRPADWGEEGMADAEAMAWVRWLGPGLLLAAHDDGWPDLVRAAVPDELPAGLQVVVVGPDGPEVREGQRPWVLGDRPSEGAVLLDSRLDRPAEVDVDGRSVPLGAGAVELVPVTGPGEGAPSARLRLRSPGVRRWSVVDDRGGAWFPEGALRKWDADGRPWFHADDPELEVPAVPLTVTCGRGMEFATATATLHPSAGTTTTAILEPLRLHDPAADGWYGADLHVHLNYSGDLVLEPHDAARMQLGEGLHLLQLLAGNLLHTRVYDREAFEHHKGHDLPWSDDERVARIGVEYRNDLLGHFHALGADRSPVRWFTGPSALPEEPDWPANAVACEDFRGMGATVTYAHPVFSPLADGTPAGAFGFPRSVEARELVADAALGLVDAVEVLGPNDADGTAVLYHHLLNCGLRLAAVAGTDVWLSYSRGPLISNPPGWCRVYADLRGAPLSVAAFQEAIAAGRTVATNGPWLTLTVDAGPAGGARDIGTGRAGRPSGTPPPPGVAERPAGGHQAGPGDVLAAAAGATVSVEVTASGPGVERLQLVGPDGVVADGPGDTPLRATFTAGTTQWLCAVARGPKHPSVPGPAVFAHTSPVWLEVADRPLRRPASARWLLDWLDRCADLIREHGRFSDDTQRDDVLAVLARARPFYEAQAG